MQITLGVKLPIRVLRVRFFIRVHELIDCVSNGEKNRSGNLRSNEKWKKRRKARGGGERVRKKKN